MGAQAILVVTSTSTGFVNEWAAESFEYLQHGDSAIVAMQYSTLPSALGLLTARDEPPKVGRLLFKAVAAKIASLPQDQRPKLYAGGESLGAYGGNGAFDSPDDMLAQVDGALWTGTPSFTDLTTRSSPASGRSAPPWSTRRSATVRTSGSPATRRS